tara:strand:- start:61 stop:234 length:174 start_codon:yes stop_codon:yes gene_type:complete
MTKLDKIIEKIRELRDASFHFCPNTTNDKLECTCHHFDEVIDELEKLKNWYQKTKPI